MSNYIESIYFFAKTIICLLGYSASILIGQPSELLANVTILSAVAFAIVAYFQIFKGE
jgi:hypothetical protein